ncbi:MAG: cupin [Flavisolibacter sp.]|nr:cupin [Flavisolibacter sp.]
MLSNSNTIDISKNNGSANQPARHIFERLKAGEPIRLDDPQYPGIQAVINRTIELSAQLNTATSIDQIRERLSKIIGAELDETYNLNTQLIIAIAFVALFGIACNGQSNKQPVTNEIQAIFPKGQLGPAENFTGKAWNIGLVANDTMYNTVVGNVYFEPGARSNWHTHGAGQILIITDGVGYHQIKGQTRQTIKKGDVVKCPPNVMHWHGANPEQGLQQMYIIPNTGKGIVQWLHPVTDEEYNNQ